MTLPATVTPEQLTAVIDSREQTPLDLTPLQTVTDTLAKPQAAIGSLLGWMASGLPVVMTGDHKRAGQFVSRLLFIAARRRWREVRTLVEGVAK